MATRLICENFEEGVKAVKERCLLVLAGKNEVGGEIYFANGKNGYAFVLIDYNDKEIYGISLMNDWSDFWECFKEVAMWWSIKIEEEVDE